MIFSAKCVLVMWTGYWS